jgi:protein TonB
VPTTTIEVPLAPAELPVADLAVGTETAPPEAPVLGPPAEALSTPPPPPRRGDLVDVNDPGVTPPAIASEGRSPYPPLALERRLSGTVWLKALVDETGRVVEVALVRTSAPGLGFEDAAIALVRSRVYTPATMQGVPVRVRLPIKVEFRAPGS